MRDLKFDEIVPTTLDIVPEIRKAYEKEATHWTKEKLGPYNLFDILLMPRVMSQLNEGGHDAELTRVFEYFEALASHPKQDVRDIVGVAVCETLVGDETALQRSVRFMGPRTKAFCDAQLKGR